MALGRPKAADRPDGVAWTVVEYGKDETVLDPTWRIPTIPRD